MGAVALPDTTIDPSSDLGRQLVVDLARYRESLVDEKTIRKRYRFDESTWQKLGDDDELIRRWRQKPSGGSADGSVKREKAQSLIVKAPDIVDGIRQLTTARVARHRLDASRSSMVWPALGASRRRASDRFYYYDKPFGDG